MGFCPRGVESPFHLLPAYLGANVKSSHIADPYEELPNVWARRAVVHLPTSWLLPSRPATHFLRNRSAAACCQKKTATCMCFPAPRSSDHEAQTDGERMQHGHPDTWIASRARHGAKHGPIGSDTKHNSHHQEPTPYSTIWRNQRTPSLRLRCSAGRQLHNCSLLVSSSARVINECGSSSSQLSHGRIRTRTHVSTSMMRVFFKCFDVCLHAPCTRKERR